MTATSADYRGVSDDSTPKRFPTFGGPRTQRTSTETIAKLSTSDREPTGNAAKAVAGAPDNTSEGTSACAPVLDAAAYYGLIGDAVKKLECYTDAPLPSLLFHLVTVAGALIGRGPYLNLLGNEQRCSIFALIVGGSGTGRKGTAWNIVRRIASVADDAFDAKVIDGLASGEAIIRRLNEWPDGAVIFESEFGRLLAAKSWSGSTLSERIRSMFDGVPISHDTKKETIRAADYHASIVGHITPTDLGEKLRQSELTNGFANRFLWCLAIQAKRLPPSQSELPRLLITEIGNEIGEALAEARKIQQMSLSKDAQTLLDHFDLNDLPSDDSTYAALLQRGTTLVVRIAMIFACFDGDSVVDSRHLKAAIALWRYAAGSVEYYFQVQRVPESHDAVAFLRDFLRDGPQAAKVIAENAALEGISGSQLRTAREKLGLTINRRGKDQDGKRCSLWSLPSAKVRAA